MTAYHPDLLARLVPRYTSYPTAAQFTGAVGARELAAQLDAVSPSTSLSLYVHIPYCHDICWYCGCNTGGANRAARLAAYVEALEQEISLVSARLGGRGKVARIAFGGGSPNALPLLDFVRLQQQLLICFDACDARVSVELDPRGLDEKWIAALAAMGVDRVNLGVQTFAPHVQKAIGRVQPMESVEAAARQLRRRDVAVGFDLMYGLPHQSQADLIQTLEQAIRLRPARVALFGYAHMPALLPRQRRIDDSALPDNAERFAMAAIGQETLLDAGYRAVGFDHFALPDDSLAITAENGALRRNFQGFTDDDSTILIGLGASAISSFPGVIVQNEKSAGRYRMLVSSGRMTANRGVRRTAADRRTARIIEDILCRQRADIGDVRTPLQRLEPFVARGLIALEGTRLTVLPDGQPYARAIAASFDAYLRPAEGRFSSAI